MAGSSLNLDWRRVADTLQSLPHGQRSAYIASVAEAVGKHPVTVRRRIQEKVGKAKTVKRSARTLTPEVVAAIAQVQASYGLIVLDKSSRVLAARDAIDIALEEGLIPYRVSASGYNTAKDRLGYNVLRTRTRFEAPYACHTYQLDFSRSKHFQAVGMDEATGDLIMRVSAKELHYKDEDRRLRTWAVQMVDDHSRTRLVQFYGATGESALLGLQFLSWAFTRPADDHPMRHLPERLYVDNGAFRTSTESRDAMQRLEIDMPKSEPGNSAARGKVERRFRTLWQRFEAPLATRLVRKLGTKATIRLSELNQLVHQAMIEETGLAHPMRPDLIGTIYQQSTLRTRPRTLGSDLFSLALRTWERSVGLDRWLSIDSTYYEAPAYAAGRRVRVYRTLDGRFVGEVIGKDYGSFTLQLAQARHIDDFASRPGTVISQHAEAEAREQAKQVVKSLAPKAEKAAPATPIEQARPAHLPLAEQPLSFAEALAELRSRLRAEGVPVEQLNGLDTLVTQGMTRADVRTLADQIITLQSSARRAA